MKIYLSGPMRGLPDHNFPAFMVAAEELRECGHEVFNPAEHDDEHCINGQFCFHVALLADLTWICNHAEAIVLLPGWATSRGVAAEIATAVAIGLPIHSVAELCP
jgi:Domain of unknown function (DUF4406)